MNFRKIFYESLPVEERDDYQDWLRKQKDIADAGPKIRLINKKLEKYIKVFFEDFLCLPTKPFSVKDGSVHYFGLENRDLIESKANKVISDNLKAFPNCCE